MQTSFNSAFGELTLHRYPQTPEQNLQAWDASDEYLLSHLKENHQLLSTKKVLIFNDGFGALSLPLSPWLPISISDSLVSIKAIHANAQTNGITEHNLHLTHSLDELSGQFDLVLVKVPKTLDYLRYFLSRIGPHVHQKTHIICAGMIKKMPKTVWTILEDKLGKTTTSLAKKKARLIFTHPIKPATEQYSPTHFIQEKTGYTIFNHANVFSQHSLDIGTRFLLDHMPHFNDIKNIIDLGCGNGIVGLNLAMKYPKAEVTFIDESYMAIESARLTMKANDADLDQHRFLVNNCLDNFSKNTADLIVCNPPFHQSHTIGLHIALQMFRQSHQTLKKGGHLVVVANRHLPYYIPLKKLFSQVKNIANNRKFNLFGMKK